MKKKPVIITIVIVAIAAILIGGGIYLYPHLVERTISEVVKNDMNDIVKISLTDRDVGDRVIEVTDKEDIEEIADNLFTEKESAVLAKAHDLGRELVSLLFDSDDFAYDDNDADAYLSLIHI